MLNIWHQIVQVQGALGQTHALWPHRCSFL
jgi:hypothetical protein